MRGASEAAPARTAALINARREMGMELLPFRLIYSRISPQRWFYVGSRKADPQTYALAGGGLNFEPRRAPRFGKDRGPQKPAVFALEAATRVRSSSLFDPMMRSSWASTSTRWASARR